MSTVTDRHSARVAHEPGPYDAGSPHSWVRDQMIAGETQLASLRAGEADEARDRLSRHAFDVADAINRRTDYGVRAEHAVTESVRGANPEPDFHSRASSELLETLRNGLRDAELRSLTTGGGTTVSASGGAAALVAPAVLLDQWAVYRSPYRAVANACAKETLPAYGTKCSIPAFTTPPSVGVQTEGSSAPDADPVMGLITDDVQPFAGQIQVSQQYLDRAGPGISGDAVMFAQLREMLDQQVDEHVIAQVLANAQPVTNNGSFTLTYNAPSGVGGFLGDVKKAKSLVRNTAGVRINATHAFAVGDFVDYIGAWSDGQQRPAFSPALDDNRLPIRSTGDSNGESYTGYIVSSLALCIDDNVPAFGTTSDLQIIVARPDTVSLFEGTPIPYLYPPSIAGSLLTILGLRSYAAAIPRYPTGAGVITGAAYDAATFA